MATDVLTGSRIRERRLISGLRQADLARQIGISASYLNLIEHNRRRIGGKLLLALADALAVEASMLTEGAEATLISALREAETSIQKSTAELDRIEDFASRFPGWAQVLAAMHRRTLQLEQKVEGLNDRLTHDPKLADSVHEVLSTAASIHSTASILAETDQLEVEWLKRFHTNIHQDSARLAESSRALAGYLDGGNEEDDAPAAFPQDDVDAFLLDNEYHFPALEPEGGEGVADVLNNSGLTPAAREIAQPLLDLIASDAARLPLSVLREALREADPEPNPIAIAHRLQVPVASLLRRLACLPEIQSGYVMCDQAGSLLLRKSIAGFAFPRIGAACPLWPLFSALNQPGTVVRRTVIQLGRQENRFLAYCAAEPIGTLAYNTAPLMRAGMLLLPDISYNQSMDKFDKMGSSCRVCSRQECIGRRERSVLNDPG